MLILLAGCSTVHGVRPLEAGQWAVEGSVGGPITEVYGAPIPLPISTVGAAYGLDGRTDLHAAVQTGALAFFGLGGLDLGVSRQFWGNDATRLMGDLTLVGIAGDVDPDGGEPGGFALFANPTVTLARDWGEARRQTVYGSLFGFVEATPAFAGLAGLAAGNRWGLGPQLGLTTELKWIAPYASTRSLTPRYLSPGELGAVSFLVGMDVRLGGGE
ncbi:MAG: hypothetical protein ACOZNI_31090 [Myxococcota bacterium]